MTKKAAAARLREFTAMSNRLHARYLTDAAVQGAYERFLSLQLDYFLPKYDVLRDRPGYDDAIDFVISDLTGTGIADRDRELERVIPAMTRLLPVKALRALALAMELNARILEINLGIAAELNELLVNNSAISELDYCLASRRVSSFSQCCELVAMTLEAGASLERIIRLPMMRSLLRSMRLPARLAGVFDLHRFLERGFDAFVALDDVPVFLDVMQTQMTAVFHRVFEAGQAMLSESAIVHPG